VDGRFGVRRALTEQQGDERDGEEEQSDAEHLPHDHADEEAGEYAGGGGGDSR